MKAMLMQPVIKQNHCCKPKGKPKPDLFVMFMKVHQLHCMTSERSVSDSTWGMVHPFQKRLPKYMFCASPGVVLPYGIPSVG